jgi:hypothetical protein
MLLAQPLLQLDDEWFAVLVANAPALPRRLAVDVAFDGEQGIDAFDGFDRDRRLVEPGEVEELAPRMCLIQSSG